MLFALSVGKAAQAAASRFELTWSHPSVEHPCISDDELKRAVAERLGRDPFVAAGDGEIAVEGRELPKSGGQLRARIIQRDREGRTLGTRDLEATTCDELRRSATFVVFLIVDPDAAFGGATNAPAQQPPPPERRPEDAMPTTEPRPPETNEGREKTGEEARRAPAKNVVPRLRSAPVEPMPVDLGLALVVSNGLLPKPDVGPAVTLGLAPLALPIRFEWRASYRVAVQSVEGYDFSAVEQQWRACFSQRVFGAAFATACGGATWTAILPEARGLARGDQAPKTVFSPTVAVAPSLEVGDTRLSFDFGLSFPYPRYAFTFREEGRALPLHEVSRFVWSVGIGASRSFR